MKRNKEKTITQLGDIAIICHKERLKFRELGETEASLDARTDILTKDCTPQERRIIDAALEGMEG